MQPTNLKAAFARASVAKDTSPVKEKLAKMRRMTSSGSWRLSGFELKPDPGSYRSFISQMDKMALKSDLDKMELNMKTATKISIAEAVDPIKSEIYEMKSDLD